MSEAKENPQCAVHYFRFPDGQCSCPHDCDNCGVTYVGPHSKDDCITVLKTRLKLDDLAEKIKTLEANQKPMSREKLIAAVKADLLANLKPSPLATMRCENTDDHYHEWEPNTPLTEASKCEACGLMATDVMSGLEPSASATDPDFVHEDDCPCFGDETPHSIDCANCTCDKSCKRPPEGWVCSRQFGHDGPCAARPKKLYQTVSKLEAGMR